ncbi:MAG: ABC transporter permease [Chloroflexi bacterium]|nr:ABC transporter permease [Chloroflexota bacterium]
MTTVLVRRLWQYGAVLFLTVSLNFLLPRLMPGDPLALLAGEDAALLPAETRAEILRRHGLDQPLWRQYIRYLGDLARADWGYSYQQKRPIVDILRERLPWTVLLTGTSLLLSTALGVLFGVLTAWRRGGASDIGILAFFLFLQSLPAFWVGMIFIAVFAVQLGWLPTFGAQTSWRQLAGWARVADILKHLVLPVATLTLVSVPGTFLITRYSMLSVLREDYILVARAKGLAERALMFRHAIRNALLPVATVFMLNLGFVVSGATVVETVFSYPGLGRLLYEAVLNRDYPVLQAAFLLITVSVIAGNILADLVYPVLDPRVRRGVPDGR